MSTLNSIFSALKGAGLTGTTLTSTVQALAANSPTSAIHAALTAVLANSGNLAVVKDEVTKLAEIPNLPQAVANLLPKLQAATTAEEVVTQVGLIETAMGPSNGLSLGSLSL